MHPLFILISALLGARTISLEEAEAAARAKSPAVRQARAQQTGAEERSSVALAPMLPVVALYGQYQRATTNFTARPGALPNEVSNLPPLSFTTQNYFSTGAQLTQLVWDFGKTWSTYQASLASSQSARFNAEGAARNAILQVRLAFFAVRAQTQLFEVAKESVANFDRHLAQTTEMVRVGVRPPIDLSRAQSDHARGVLLQVQAQAAVRQAQIQLLQAMGDTGDPEIALGEGALGAPAAEAAAAEALMEQAKSTRPELHAAEADVRAAESTRASASGAIWPALGVGGNVSFDGPALSALRWNYAGLVLAQWNLFEGGASTARERAARADLVRAEATRDATALQVRTELLQARVQIDSAKQALAAAEELVRASKNLQELAEGRYASGVGNSLEVSDAQVVFIQASAQKISADFDLTAARARLLAALGMEAR